MKHKHYTNEEILKIKKLLSKGRTYREIATMLNRDYTRLVRKINELGLHRFKKKSPKVVKKTENKKVEHYSSRLSYSNRLSLCFYKKDIRVINEITKYRSELLIKDFHFHSQGTVANIYTEMITGILRALKYNLIFEDRDNIVIQHNNESYCYTEVSFDNWLEDFLLKCKIQNRNYAKSEQFLKLIKKRLGDTRL